jgi:surface polysaccharide O-acyltransferase-like enzyme
MKMDVLSKSISEKFKFWSFISIVLIVFLHSYNLQQRYLRPWTTVQEKLTPTGFTEYFVANGILRPCVPILFAISGFLYALHDSVPNRKRLPKRIRTLVLPYLAWSALAIALTYCMELSPYTRSLVLSSRIAYIDSTRMLLHDYYWYELLRKWLINPLAYQLWFLRILFLFNLAYPFLRWCVMHKTARWIFFSAVVILWIRSFESVCEEAEGLLFFSLGIWLNKTNLFIETTTKRYQNAIVCGSIFIIFAAIKSWLAFEGYDIMGQNVFPVLILMHKLVVVSGLIFYWFGFDALIRRCMHNRKFVWLSAFSFFIYLFHAPLVGYAINGMLSWLNPLAACRILTFVLLPLTIIALSIFLGALLRSISAGSYKILTGGRGG